MMVCVFASGMSVVRSPGPPGTGVALRIAIQGRSEPFRMDRTRPLTCWVAHVGTDSTFPGAIVGAVEMDDGERDRSDLNGLAARDLVGELA